MASATIHDLRALGALGLLLFASGASVACSTDEPSQVAADTQRLCNAQTLEPDLDAIELAGRGVDPATGKLSASAGESFVVSSTYGVPVPGEDGASVSARYQTLFEAVAAQLQKEPGLIAMQLASSSACGSGRTLAVWSSEETMYDFVTSDAHVAAMVAAPEILKPGYAVTHWNAATPEQATFAEATRRFEHE